MSITKKILGEDGLRELWAIVKGRFSPINSPAFTGTPTAPTAASGTNTTQVATTAFVKAADDVLSARMDTFTNLPSGSTAGDAELADIRVGADGVTYANAGDAVRGQTSNLKDTLLGFEFGGVYNGNKTTDSARIRASEFSFLPKGTQIAVENSSTISSTTQKLYIYEFSRPAYGTANVITASGWVEGYTVQNDAYVIIVMRRNDGNMTQEQATAVWNCLRIYVPKTFGTAIMSQMDAVSSALDALESKLSDTLLDWEFGTIYNGNKASDNARIRATEFLFLPKGSKISTENVSSASTVATPLVITEFSVPKYGTANVIAYSGWTGEYFVQNDSYVIVVMRRNDGNMTQEQATAVWNCLRIYVPKTFGTAIINEIDSKYGGDDILLSYYRTEVNDTMNKLSALPSDNFNYILITDIHYSHSDFSHRRLTDMMNAFKIIANTSNIDAVLCLGDLIEGGKSAEKSTSKNQINMVVEQFSDIRKPVMFSKGNHDDNAYNWWSWESSDKTTSKYISDDEFVSMCERPFGNGGLVYAKDFPDKNTRVIVANTCEYSEIIDSSGNVSITKPSDIRITSSQLDKIADMLFESTYDIVVFTHGIASDLFSLINSYNTRSTYTKSDSSTVSFSASTHTVNLIHVGHYHNDAMEYCDTYNVNAIATSCGSLASVQQNATGDGNNILTSWVGSSENKITTIYPRTKGTANEACFDVVSIGNDKITKIRFGAGADGVLEL